MANTIEIAILGMGRIGASMGLAIKRYNAGKNTQQQFRVTGYDSESANITEANSKGAFDIHARTIFDAAHDKALVIVALPYAEISQTYRDFATGVNAGTVIMDMSPLKSPSLALAAKHLPENVYMVGATPILNAAYLFDGVEDTAHAAADLFDNGGMLVLPNAGCPPEAVELVSDLCTLIGAPPRFADPQEHDGWAAAVEGLPMALGVAAFYALTKADGWRDAQQQAGHSFGRLIHHLYDTHPDDLRDIMLNNRDNLIRHIDGITDALDALRDTLAQGDRDTLEAVIEETTDAAHLWVIKRRENKWDKVQAPPRPDIGAHMSSLIFGGALAKRIRGDKNGSA